ncbi:MAG: YhdP family protein [Gammaproteobacteria bacterium]
MKFPRFLLSCTHRALCWGAGLAAAAATFAAGAAALMYFWILPNIADHRDGVAALMSRALGQQVTLEAVSGAWQQARPEFRLQGVRLHDREGRLALELPELEAAFAWRSLLFLEPRFNHIELKGLALDVRRAHDGHLYVGGIPVNPAAPDSGFVNWLLRQGRVHVGDATLTWRDEVRAAPAVVMEQVDFTLTNARRSHVMEFRAVPPADLARPLTAEARLQAQDIEDLASWRGTVDARVAGVSFPRLATWVTLPATVKHGWGALGLRLSLDGGQFSRMTAGLDLRALELRLSEGLPGLQFTQARGRALWQRETDGRQRVSFEDVRVTRPGTTASGPFNVGLSWGGGRREISARALSLDAWESLLPSLPMDEALRQRLQALQPQGRFDTLRFGWRGAEPALDNFSVTAHFSGLGVRTVDDQPGWHNLSGRLEGDSAAGSFALDSQQLVVSLPGVMREPDIALDRLSARGSWKKTARGHRLHIEESRFANADLEGSLQGDYERIAGTAGVADLSAQLTRADGTAVHRYFPKKVGDNTVDWVREGVRAGYSDDVKLRLKGDLSRFPFENGEGVFRIDIAAKDAVIDYVPGWPRIEDIQAHILFEGKRMEVQARQAKIFGATLAPVKAVIPDLIHHEELLEIDGVANGPAQDFIRFANESPVGARLRGFTDGLGGTGPMRLALRMTVPLRHSHDTTLSGRLSFLGDSLLPPALPRLDQVRGDIEFTHERLTAREITAQFLGGPLRVVADTQPGGVRVRAQGSVTAAGLAAWLGPAWNDRLAGQTAWRGQLDLESRGARIGIESNLVGLTSNLPLPLAKPAAMPLPLQVSVQPQGDGRRHAVRLGNLFGAAWQTAANGAWSRGEVRFGGPATLPAEAGLRVAGRSSVLDLSGWLALLPEGEAGKGVALTALDLDLDALDLMGRRFHDLRLQGRARNGLLRGQVTGRGVDGVLTYRPRGAEPARVSAQFGQLVIPPRASASGGGGGRTLQAELFPALDLSVQDFRLEDRPLGRLETVARGTPQGLVIDSLQLVHDDSVFHMSGLWRDGVPTETRAELKLNVQDAGKFLARFGYPELMARGSAEFQGNATWVGSPADFAFDTLAGQIAFKAKGGQFLKVDPGAGKLLGVLSLQSLPRRLSFDFRDIFNQGYAFDDAGATLRIARGVVYSDDFQMRGPAAKVNMSGLANLDQEAVQLRVKVIPKLSESVAVAGALLGGPVAGVGALAAQKLLRDPIEEIISREYLISGPWQAPDVKRLPKTKAEPPPGPQMSEP